MGCRGERRAERHDARRRPPATGDRAHHPQLAAVFRDAARVDSTGALVMQLARNCNRDTIRTVSLIAGRIPNLTPDAKATPPAPVAPEYRSREAHRGRFTERHYRAPRRDWTGWTNGAGTLRALRVSPMSESRRHRRTGRRWDFQCLLCGGEASYWPRWVEQGRRMSCGCLRRGSRLRAPGVAPRLSDGSAQGCQVSSQSEPQESGRG